MNYKELPKITDKQKEIMDLVFRFRFVNRHQIQKLLHHKDPKRINTWLRDLVSKNYLGRIYSHKLLENTKPAIYYLNNNGILWVRYDRDDHEEEPLEFKYLKKFYEDKHASLTFISHCVSLAEFYLQFKDNEYRKNLDKKKEVIEYDFQTKTEIWIDKQHALREDEDFNQIKQYIPDLEFEIIKNPYSKKLSTQLYFLELFDPRMPRYAIKYRIKQYIKYREEDRWKNYRNLDGIFPAIILIFPHYRKMNSMVKFIQDELMYSYESKGLTFMLTTYQKAMTETLLAGDKIWKFIQGE